jgi:type I restriction enzyme S subunit
MSMNATTATPTTRRKVVPLGEVVDFNPRFGKDEIADDSLASFIPMKCVEEESGQFEPIGDRKVADVRKGYTPFRDGDVIFAKVTPCMENGKAAVLKGLTNGVGFGSTEFFALRPKNGLEAKYLFHFILQSNFRRDAARNMTGAVGLRRVPKQWLEQQTIPLPEPYEQRRIVAEIEKQFTRLEAGVAALRRVQANLKRYRAAVLKAACEGRLTADWRKEKRTTESAGDLLARTHSARRLRYDNALKEAKKLGTKKPKKDYEIQFRHDPTLPDSWVTAKLDNLIYIAGRIGWRGLKAEEYTKAGPLFLSVYNLNYGEAVDYRDAYHISRERYEESPEIQLQESDILLAKDGAGIGKIAIVKHLSGETTVNSSLLVIRALEAFIPKYLFYFLAGPELQSLAKQRIAGSATPHLFQKDIRQFYLSVPPLAEQTRIVAEVEWRLTVVEELESVVSADLQRATRLRQSILQKAFTGNLI